MHENNYFNLKTLIMTFINLYKGNYDNLDYLKKLFIKSHFITKDYLTIILQIYLIYENELESSGYLDFNDLIIKATNLIRNNQVKTDYKLIIIDEFQDTSLVRLNLILAIIKSNQAKIFAVGDDYQSIYRFSGCDLNVFININKYINNIKILKLNINYRNNQEIMNISNNFIMKNKVQIKKNTICFKNNSKPIKIVYYVDKTKVMNKVLKKITGNILILGRNNMDKDLFNIIETENIKYLTIHKSKGLEEDNVILVNLENNTMGLPSKIKNNKIINKIIKQDCYPYEEERRLFCVALTRTRNNIFLLVPKNNYSVFVKELIKDYYKYIDILN
jgi:DNA helicase-4